MPTLGKGLGHLHELPDQRGMHWSEVAGDGSDPTLPDGAEPLARYVKAPTQLARRLAQVGVVERDAGIRLAAGLKTGQRLVSRDGDLWRWDGFVAAAHAPTGAARRLAQRNRFAEIDTELESARGDVEAKRRTLEAAQSAFDAASSIESETRARERDLNRQAARLSALAEARARLTMTDLPVATSIRLYWASMPRFSLVGSPVAVLTINEERLVVKRMSSRWVGGMPVAEP